MGHQPIKFISLTMSSYDAGKGGAMLAHQLPCMETRVVQTASYEQNKIEPWETIIKISISKDQEKWKSNRR